MEQLRPAVPDDLTIMPSAPSLRYCHRVHDGVHFYLLVNEGETRVEADAAFAQKTMPEIWDAESGETRKASQAAYLRDQVHLPVDLGAHQPMIVVFDPGAKAAGASDATLAPQRMEISIPFIGWRLQLGHLAVQPAQLGSWTYMPEARSFSGTGWYRYSFELPGGAVPERSRIFLDCGSVLGFAEAKVNGTSAGVRLWAPFRFEVTGMIKPGANDIEVGVTNTRANELLPQKFDAGLMGPIRLVIER